MSSDYPENLRRLVVLQNGTKMEAGVNAKRWNPESGVIEIENDNRKKITSTMSNKNYLEKMKCF